MRTLAAGMRRSSPQLQPGQMSALFRLSCGPSTVSELARYLGVSLPTGSKSISVMEKRGWIERGVDEQCRRQTIVRLTPEGRKVTAGKHRQSEHDMEAMLDGLTPAQRSHVLATVEM